MRVRFLARTSAQIDKALAYVSVRSPQGAANIRARIQAAAAFLQEQPLAGQRTSDPKVRRVVSSPFPYLIFYRVTATEIVVLRFRHAARRPPN